MYKHGINFVAGAERMDIQNIKKWGNSAGVRIPSAMLKAAHLEIDTPVQIREENGRIIVEPLPVEKQSLEQIMEKVTPEMLHEDMDFGKPAGSEAW
jgi:antitoxin MazE